LAPALARRSQQTRQAPVRGQPGSTSLFIPLMQAYMPLTMARPTPLAFDKAKIIAQEKSARAV